MRLRILPLLVGIVLLLAPAVAQADFPHLVAPGESLYSIAAADGLSVSQLAAANGLAPGAQLITGSVLMIPPQSGATSSGAGTGASSSAGDGDADSDDPAQATPVSSHPVGDGDGDSDDVASGATTAPASQPTQAPGGSYVVQPGDTLSAIAARAGTSVAQLAAANGLNAGAYLLTGTALSLSGAGSSQSSAASQPVGVTAEGSMTAPPYPTPERVNAAEVGNVASATGVPSALAQAIGWQESGFNNNLVSSAGARGVMQILPGTWAWINQTMAGNALAPASALSNVRGGALLLHSLLNSTGGDQGLAAAGYYQGLPSVLAHGMYSDTQHYVNDVMSLEHQFGGF